MSPSKLYDKYRLQFYATDRPEPPHVHVFYSGNEAKFWLNPVELAKNHGYNASEINRIRKLLLEHQAELVAWWYDYFGEADE